MPFSGVRSLPRALSLIHRKRLDVAGVTGIENEPVFQEHQSWECDHSAASPIRRRVPHAVRLPPCWPRVPLRRLERGGNRYRLRFRFRVPFAKEARAIDIEWENDVPSPRANHRLVPLRHFVSGISTRDDLIRSAILERDPYRIPPTNIAGGICPSSAFHRLVPRTPVRSMLFLRTHFADEREERRLRHPAVDLPLTHEREECEPSTRRESSRYIRRQRPMNLRRRAESPVRWASCSA